MIRLQEKSGSDRALPVVMIVTPFLVFDKDLRHRLRIPRIPLLLALLSTDAFRVGLVFGQIWRKSRRQKPGRARKSDIFGLLEPLQV